MALISSITTPFPRVDQIYDLVYDLGVYEESTKDGTNLHNIQTTEWCIVLGQKQTGAYGYSTVTTG